MNNLQIKKLNKRSVQSIIEDSAIDYAQTFNFEIFQMKKAFTQSTKSMNLKIAEQTKQIDRLLIKNRQIIQTNKYLQMRQVQLQNISNQQIRKCKQLEQINQKLKKRLKLVQNKLQTIQDNRSLAMKQHLEKDEFQLQNELVVRQTNNQLNILRTDVYKQITDILNIKIRQFTQQLKQFPMSRQVQSSIQVFLEQLIYITPHSTQNGFKFRSHKDRDIGKISRKTAQNISDQQEWKNMQKSIQKLKASQMNKNNGQGQGYGNNSSSKKQNTFNRAVTPKRQRKTSPFSYSYSPLQNGDGLEHSNINTQKSKKKIFQN